MLSKQHLTSRRGFITAFGFGGVALYGAWAAYGAAPLPFGQRIGNAEHGASPSGTLEAPGGHGGAPAMSSAEFLQRHEAFLAQYRAPDGSVVVTPPAAAADVRSGAPEPESAHGGHGAPQPQAPHGAHMPPAVEAHMAHPSAGAPAAHGPQPGSNEPIDIYLLAFRFGFTPDELHLRAGQPYRFRMLASDVTHGASLQFGNASRIVRLRANVVSEQTITFNRPGRILVYCTVFCGPAHDAMSGRIVVA